MLGLIEAANRAFQEMKSPKDVFFLDFDKGEWKVVTEKQMEKMRT